MKLLHFNNLEELLAFNIKYYRYKKNMSQEQLAELADLSPRYITDIERGIHSPTMKKLEKISYALEVEPYELLKNDKKDKKIINKLLNSRQYNQNCSK